VLRVLVSMSASVYLCQREFSRKEAPADMIGTTRFLVSFFMRRLCKLGPIEYNGRIQVHQPLLEVVVHDQLPEKQPGEVLLSGALHGVNQGLRDSIDGRPIKR
jgi:hypothetical protein